MSNTLFVSMFTRPQLTRKERLRARRKRLLEKAAKLSIYVGFVGSFAVSADNPVQYAGVVSGICVAFEIYLKALR